MGVKTSPRTVLLVDDDVLVRNLLRRNLEMAGFSVLAAANAAEALDVWRACNNRIDALLTDVEMAGGDGITLAEQLTRERTDMAVLIMSGGTARVVPESMAYISKPFSAADLIARLIGILEAAKVDDSRR